MLKILTSPNDTLSKKSLNYVFKKTDDKFSSFLKNMEEALLEADDPKGVGLAAPQVGKSLRIFLAKPKDNSKITVYINPEIIKSEEVPKKNLSNRKLSKTKSTSGTKSLKKLEGCLSLPNIWGEVLRAPSITIKYLDQNGNNQTKKFDGFMATIVQHEIDHLDGILFPKRVLEQGGLLYKSHKDKKGQDVFEEISI